MKYGVCQSKPKYNQSTSYSGYNQAPGYQGGATPAVSGYYAPVDNAYLDVSKLSIFTFKGTNSLQFFTLCPEKGEKEEENDEVRRPRGRWRGRSYDWKNPILIGFFQIFLNTNLFT